MLWILWNQDYDFAVQAIDSWLFATVISLITITAALSRSFKCQNTDFFLNLYYKCIQTWQAFSKIHLDVKAAVSLISIPNSLNLCLYAFFFFFFTCFWEFSPLHDCLHLLWEEVSFPEGEKKILITVLTPEHWDYRLPEPPETFGNLKSKAGVPGWIP